MQGAVFQAGIFTEVRIEFFPVFVENLLCRKPLFRGMKPPLRQPCPRWGRGRIAMLLYYLYGKFLYDYVLVIRHYRNRGMP
jgi:hypothetical protein